VVVLGDTAARIFFDLNTGNMKYDVFLSYADEDEPWVSEKLIPRLEAAGLKFVDEYAFQVGSPLVSEMRRAIQESTFTVLVLSPTYLADHWSQFEQTLVLTKNLVEGTWQALPVIVHPCEPPDELKGLVHVDLTDDSPRAWDRLIRRLTAQEPAREPPSQRQTVPLSPSASSPRFGTILGINVVLLGMFFLIALAVPKSDSLPNWLQNSLVIYGLFCALHGINLLVSRQSGFSGKFTIPVLNLDVPGAYLGSKWLVGNLWRGMFLGGIGVILLLFWWKPALIAPPVDATHTPTPTLTQTLTPTATDFLTLTPTQTNPPSESPSPTGSPTATFTPLPTDTPDPNAAKLPGQDLSQDCVDASLWKAYELHPIERDGCLDLFQWGFVAQNGGLQLQFQETKNNNIMGLYTSVGSQAEIEFKVRMNRLFPVRDLDAIFMMGVIPTNPVDTKSGRYLYIFEGGGSLNIAIDQPDKPRVFHAINEPIGKTYQVTLVVQGRGLEVFVDGERIPGSIDLPFSDRAFWIGYNLWKDEEIEVFLSDLCIHNPGETPAAACPWVEP